MGDKRCICRVLVGRPEGKRPFGRHGRRWKDIIKRDLHEFGWGGTVKIDLAQDGDMWRALVIK
jgi:hypothetical protein